MTTDSITVTLDSIKYSMRNAMVQVKDEYVKESINGSTKEHRFTVAAQRVAKQVLEKSSIYNELSGSQKAELDKYIKEQSELLADEYLAECKAKKLAGEINFSSSSSTTNKNGYDYDPYTENGLSIYPVDKTVTATNGLGQSSTKSGTGKASPIMSHYHATNSSFSGADMVVTVSITPNGDVSNRVVATLGTLQTISFSIYEDKKPVRVLGNRNAKDWVSGSLTIAGSLVFAVFNKNWLIEIYDELKMKVGMKNWHFLATEIPPMTITITAANEYGYDSKMALYGVRLMQEGMTISTQDIYIENTYQFIANDIDYLDTLYSYQTRAARHGVYNITREYIKNDSFAENKIEPYIFKFGEEQQPDMPDNPEEEVNKPSIEEEQWKNSLSFTEANWNKYLADSKGDANKAKKAALDKLKSTYDELKKDINDKAKKATLKIYYEESRNKINELYTKTKNGTYTSDSLSADAAPNSAYVDSLINFDSGTYDDYVVEAVSNIKNEVNKSNVDAKVTNVREYADGKYKALWNKNILVINNNLKGNVVPPGSSNKITQADIAYANSVKVKALKLMNEYWTSSAEKVIKDAFAEMVK